MKKFVPLLTLCLFTLIRFANAGTIFNGPERTTLSYDVPYNCDFSSYETMAEWTVIDANNDETTWGISGGGVSDNYVWFARYMNHWNNDGNDWLISPSVKLKAGINYKLNFDLRTAEGFNEHLKVFIGKGKTIANQTTLLADYVNVQLKDFTTKAIEFTVEQDGEYNLGFYCCSVKNLFKIDVTNIAVSVSIDNDMQALSVSGNDYPSVGKESKYRVKIKNVGRLSQNNFKVQLVNNEGGVLAETQVTEGIESDQIKIIDVLWTPIAPGKLSIKGKVILDGDVDPLNDSSSEIMVEVQSSDSPLWAKIGNKEKTTKNYPFDFYYEAGTAQTIYLSEEIGTTGGLIEFLRYPYKNESDEEITDKYVTIYMANTNLVNLEGGWIPISEFKLVFSGNISIPYGEGVLTIPLTNKFIYSGNNLCLMTGKEKISDYFLYTMFYATSDAENRKRVRYFSSDYEAFNFTQEGVVEKNVPDVYISMKVDEGAQIMGMVTDESGPMADVEIKLVELGISVYSDAEGKYAFAWLPAGTYTLDFIKFGYPIRRLEEVTVESGQTEEIDMEMSLLPSFKVSGKVLDNDNNPLQEVTITITGYKEFTAITDEQGEFLIQNVIKADNYKIEFSKDGFNDYSQDFNIIDADLNLETIQLSDILIAPAHVSLTKQDDDLMIKWIDGNSLETFRYDDGIVNDVIGLSNATPWSVVGAVHTTPALLTGMTWYTTDFSGPHDKVNCYVFDINSEGKPGKLLFSQKNVSGEDLKWSKFVFPKAVNCPNGFMIAIAFDGYVSLAYDHGNNPDYPFVTNKQMFTADYENGNWQTLESQEVNGNLLIRGLGVKLENDNSELLPNSVVKSLHGYKVWRLKEGEEAQQDKWTLLTQDVVSATNFKDIQWASQPDGSYKYAVKTIYSGGKTSDVKISEMIDKNMTVKITIKLTTNTLSNESAGALVKLTNNDGDSRHIYEGVADDAGHIVFENVWKGIYSLKVTHIGFEDYSENNVDLSATGPVEIGPYQLIEIIEAPNNLEIIDEGTPSERLFNWNITSNISDDFERIDDFEINPAGNNGWQYIDGDNYATYTFVTGSYSFPNMGEKMAFITFNPYKTTPSMENVGSILPYEGKKFLGCFSSRSGQNDDYLISPELDFRTDFEFSFYAKSYSITYGLEQFMVGYSLTGKEKSDFIWLTEKPVYAHQGVWEQFKYTIPKDARYVTLHCVSKNQFILMVDNIFIGRPSTRSFKEYEVYLDGKKVAVTTDPFYKFSKLTGGRHTAGVKTITTSGSSNIVNINFEVPDSVDENVTSGINIYPNPVSNILNFDAGQLIVDKIEIYNETGKQVYSKISNFDVINLSDLASGIYTLVVYSGENRIIKKFVKL